MLNPAISSNVFLLHDEIILDCLVTVENCPKVISSWTKHLKAPVFILICKYRRENEELNVIEIFDKAVYKKDSNSPWLIFPQRYNTVTAWRMWKRALLLRGV